MNIIEVTSNHEMFFKEFSGTLENFIFDEFAIILTTGNKVNIGVIIFFEQGVSGTRFYLFELGDKFIKKEVYYEMYLSEKYNDGLEVMCNINDHKYLNIGHDLAQFIIRTMVYIMSYSKGRVERLKSSGKSKVKNKKICESRSRENKVYLLDEIVEYVNENGLMVSQSGTHKMNCPCWNVRGHYRHYKSGKVVFVKEYKKGKDRANTKPKDCLR